MVKSQAVLIVAGISARGKREILSVDIGNSENEQEWSEVFDRLRQRCLKGVQYVVSDNHQGLVKAVKQKFQGASPQDPVDLATMPGAFYAQFHKQIQPQRY